MSSTPAPEERSRMSRPVPPLEKQMRQELQIDPMKITNIRSHVLGARLSEPFAYSRAWYDTRTAHIVEIETDQGLVGWGECYGPARMTAAVVESVAPWLIGEDPLRIDHLWR